MLLAVDVGNSNIVVGLYDGENLKENWRISTIKDRTADEYGVILKNLFKYSEVDIKVSGIIISSVVPPVMPALREMSKKYFDIEPVVIGPGIKTKMPIKYENPREVGADRIVNAVAAYDKYGGPVIVVDYGTATTFCAVSEQGEYLGGCIAPGVGISTEALFNKAAKLPRIQIEKPPNVIGRNTVQSMQSGIYYGFIGQLDGMVLQIKKELGHSTKVVATGGIASLIAPDSREVDIVDPLLTLEGLRIIFKANRG
ncbi:type III pantothenate kinase [Proteinivorax hydrogeniformans]|uniref:Type III pantothenate kinase n=1 Tax=Proteinivorax hydrogeniformans TaxID=1826727 RepID=A0AAU8HTY3_9FIRM